MMNVNLQIQVSHVKLRKFAHPLTAKGKQPVKFMVNQFINIHTIFFPNKPLNGSTNHVALEEEIKPEYFTNAASSGRN